MSGIPLRLCFAFLVFVTVFPGRLRGQSNEPPARLAILTEATEASVVADLLTVELSAKAHLQILERAQIQRVYREQQLSAANHDYVSLGQVLGADGLLILTLTTEGTNVFLSARLVAVKPGVLIRNLRTPWPLPDAPGWARWVGNHFRPFLLKLSVSAKDAIPISMVNLQSAIRSTETQELARQLTVLTIERLTRERALFVLERRRMNLLSAEKELPGIGESTFWSGSYLLDGTIDRYEYSKDTVTVNARLVPPRGGAPQLIEASGSRGNPAEVAAKLAKALTEALKLRSLVPPWNLADEAEQYFQEGTRAYSWKMLPEAQAACESAWALGKRTKDVAAFRLRAYGGDILPEAVVGNIEIPAVPQPGSLRTAIRALRLFAEDQSLAMSATNMLDEEWFDLGLYTVLRPAAAVLDGYYHAAELRHGNEEQLEELRGLARQAAAVLETNLPPGRQPGGPVDSPQRMDEAARRRWAEGPRFWQYGNTLWKYEWEQGGLWFEKPEDALPMSHRALKAGYHPASLPRVVGWSWTQRQRVPGLVRQFVNEVCASTNSAVRLEGLYLAVVRTPFDAERQDRRCVEKLIAALWADREQIWTNPAAASLFKRTEQALEHKYYVWTSPVSVEPFASFKQQFRIGYLRSASAWNQQVFAELFPFWSTYCSCAEARELLPHLEAFIQRLNLTKGGEPRSTLQKLTRDAGAEATAQIADNTNTNRPVWPAEKPLLVQFIPWKADHSGASEDLKPVLVDALVREGKLWGSIHYEPADAWIMTPRSLLFLAVEQTTGKGEAVSFPKKVGGADGRFAVSADSLFAIVGDELHRYPFRKQTWEQIPVPIPEGGSLFVVNDRLYIATSDSLLEFSPDTTQVQILVSARRSPPATPLDLRWKPEASVYPMPDGRLGVYLGGELFTFTPSSRVWDEGASLQFRNGKTGYKGGWIREFVSNDGIFLCRAIGRFELFALWKGEKELDLLLATDAGTAGRPRTSLPAEWNWPTGLSLLDSCGLAEGRSLWYLCPRKTGVTHNEELVRFADERQATLLHFEPGLRAPLCIPIQFEQAGKLIDPFAGFHRGLFAPGETAPFWLDTPDGLVFTVPASPGHWLLSKAALEPRLQALRNKPREAGEPHFTPPVTTGNQKEGNSRPGGTAKPGREVAKP